jgi:heat-inducible transcriptional repressor
MLTERQLEIVLAVVYEYIRSGEPAGSRTISKKYLRGCSPATIRNEMSDLEELGFFSQLHMSSGRLPTSRAYRVYVDSIMQRKRQDVSEADILKGDIRSQEVGIESLLSHVTQLLGRVTNYVGVAAVSSLENTEIQKVNFIPLGGSTALLLIVLKGGLVHHTNVSFPCDMRPDTLDELARRINSVALGRPWSQVRTILHDYVVEGLEHYSELCRSTIAQMDTSLREHNYRVFIGGAKNILSLPDFQDIAKLQAVLSLLEEEKALADMVEKCAVSGTMSVTIGEENQEELRECSMVLVPAVTSGQRTVLGLLGPLRMDYERSISILESVAESLEESL